MTARLLRGTGIAEQVRADVAADVAAFRERHGHAPELAVVIVGRDAPSTVYLHKILDGCRLVGIGGRLVELPVTDSGAGRVHIGLPVGSLGLGTYVLRLHASAAGQVVEERGAFEVVP